MGVKIRTSGSFKNTKSFFKFVENMKIEKILEQYGRLGVEALSQATPIDSGNTAGAWNYDVHRTGSGWELTWTNDNINEGVPIAILIQYGHGLHQGGYVQGVDYINPALGPVFEKIANEAWSEVTSA